MLKRMSAVVGISLLGAACTTPTYTASGIPAETLQTCSNATFEYFDISQRLAEASLTASDEREVLATTIEDDEKPLITPAEDLERLEQLKPLFQVCQTLIDREVLAQAYRSGSAHTYISSHYGFAGPAYRSSFQPYYPNYFGRRRGVYNLYPGVGRTPRSGHHSAQPVRPATPPSATPPAPRPTPQPAQRPATRPQSPPRSRPKGGEDW